MAEIIGFNGDGDGDDEEDYLDNGPEDDDFATPSSSIAHDLALLDISLTSTGGEPEAEEEIFHELRNDEIPDDKA